MGNTLDNIVADHEDAAMDEAWDAVRTATVDREFPAMPIGRRAGARPP